MNFQIFRSKALFRPPQWYWRLRARNGEIIAQSEGYRNVGDCQKTVALIIAEVGAATVTFRDAK